MIHGWFGAQGRPYVFAAVTLPRLGYTHRVRLLVDTGADVTSLHPMDCEGLAYEMLGVTSETTGIGGTVEYYREPALLTFRAFEKVTTPATLLYRAVNGYGSCLHTHSTITEAAICADAFVTDRGYAPCGTCSKEIGAAIFSQTPCFKHQQTAGVEEISGRPLATQEIHFGIQLEALQSKSKPLPNSNIKPVEVQPDIQPQPDTEQDERRTRRQQRRA